MSEPELIQEIGCLKRESASLIKDNELLRIENGKLTLRLSQTLEIAHRLQKAAMDTDCSATGLVNFLLNTNR